MVSRPSPSPRSLVPAGWLRGLCIGAVCLGAGIWIGGHNADRRGGLWNGPGVDAAAAAPPVAPVAVLGPAPLSFAEVVERVSPGVVSVRSIVPTEKVATAPLPGTDGEASLGVRNGSGFLLNAAGLVVTARHLTVAATRIVVEVPRIGRFDAELVGEDDVTDIAVVRLVGAPGNLPTLELGRSEDLRAGDWIVAVGNPYGFTQSVTAGVVSFVGRHLQHFDSRVSSDFLQFSAPVNPGSSGCPVLDLQGRVVGVTSQAADAAQGISFAIPSRTLKWVLEAMDHSKDGRVHRGQLGISFDVRTGLDGRGRPLEGAVVHQVADGGAAQGAGLQPGDVVLYFEGQAVPDPGELHERITRSQPGTTVRLTVMRDNRVLEPIAVALRDAASPRDRDAELFH